MRVKIKLVEVLYKIKCCMRIYKITKTMRNTEFIVYLLKTPNTNYISIHICFIASNACMDYLEEKL